MGSNDQIEMQDLGEKLMRQIGALNEAKQHLNSLTPLDAEPDPEDVARWFVIFGRAVAAILKI